MSTVQSLTLLPANQFYNAVNKAADKVVNFSVLPKYVIELQKQVRQFPSGVSTEMFAKVWERYGKGATEQAEERRMMYLQDLHTAGFSRQEFGVLFSTLNEQGVFDNVRSDEYIDMSFVVFRKLTEEQQFEVVRILDKRFKTGVLEEYRGQLFRSQASSVEHRRIQTLDTFDPTGVASKKATAYHSRKCGMQGFLTMKYGKQRNKA